MGAIAEVERAAFEAVSEWGRAALAIGREVRRQRPGQADAKHDAFDLATPADRAVEEFLVAAIRARFPGHAILGEEGGARAGDEPWQWVIDPVDGTFNFFTGLPGAACSIALQRDDELVVGAVADYASGTVFRARRGGPLVSDRPGWAFDPAARGGPGKARLFLEFGGEVLDAEMLHAMAQLAAIRPVVPRLVGSAAIALLAAALQGGSFIGIGLRLWDVAGGVVLAEQAGLATRWWRGEPPLVHLLVGEAADVEAFAPLVSDLAQRWHAASARLIPASRT